MLEIQVTAHQPLALGVRPVGNAPVPTQLHVPGSVLRGALATAWIRDHGLPVKVSSDLLRDFIDLFESDTVYGPLFAAGSGIVPLSVRHCKYGSCPGVHPDDAFPAEEATDHCPSCGGPLTAGRGEVEFFGTSTQNVIVQSVHLEIDDRTGTNADGALYTRRALSHREASGQERQFHGRIVPSPNLSPRAAAWLALQRPLRLGGRRGTSGGVTCTTRAATPSLPATADRIALRLQSPALLTDSSGIPLDLSDLPALAEALNEELSAPLGTRITGVARLWARRERAGGWHAASRLPKPVELAVSAGSVILLDLEHPPTPEALLAVCERGIGLRRGEGFGAIETATEAWQHPGAHTADPVTDERQQHTVAAADPAENYAWTLFNTGHADWFIDQLRPYAEELADGGLPHTTLLERNRLRTLDPYQRETVERLLLTASADVLDRTISALRGLTLIHKEAQNS